MFAVTKNRKALSLRAQLRNLASSGSLQAEDLVWKEGLSEWVPARKVKDLFVKPPASPKRSTPPPQPLPTLAYDDDVTSSGDNDDRGSTKAIRLALHWRDSANPCGDWCM